MQNLAKWCSIFILASGTVEASGINSFIDSSFSSASQKAESSINSMLGSLNLSSLSSYLDSASSVISANINCRGAKPNLPSASYGADSVADSINFSLGGCKISASQEKIKCFKKMLSGIKIDSSRLLPKTFITRGIQKKINTDSCEQSSPSVSVSAIIAAGMTPMQRAGNSYRECLTNGGSDCKKSAFQLPSNIGEYQSLVSDGAKMLTSDNMQNFSNSLLKESQIRKAAQKCSTAECAGQSILLSGTEEEKSITETVSNVSSGIAVAIDDSTSPKYYPFDASEEAKNFYPLELRNEFNDMATTASKVEATSRALTFEASNLRRELYRALSQKVKIAATPVLSGEAIEYAQEVANAK